MIDKSALMHEIYKKNYLLRKASLVSFLSSFGWLKLLVALCWIDSSAISPIVKVAVFYGHTKRHVGIADPFVLTLQESYYTVQTAERELAIEKAEEGAAESALASVAMKQPMNRVQNNAAKEPAKEPHHALPDHSAHAPVVGGSVDVEIKFNDLIAGVSVGAIWDFSQPNFRKSLHVPGLEEKLDHLDKEYEAFHKKYKEEKKAGDKAGRERDHPVKEKLQAKQKEWEAEKKIEVQEGHSIASKDLMNSITVNRGVVPFGGVYGGIYLTERIGMIAFLNVATRNTEYEVMEAGRQKKEVVGWKPGAMTGAKLTFAYTERIELMFMCAWIYFFNESIKSAEPAQEGKPKDTPKTPEKKEEPKLVDNHSMLIASLGMRALVMN